MELKGKKVLVLGAAKSGIASAKFLLDRGAVVALADRKPLEEWSQEAQSLKDSGVGLVPGEVPSWLLDQIEVLVLSPGVPAGSIPVRYADRAGALVIGEVELAARFVQGRMVAITGSNGKTTTTTLTGELLRNAGIEVQVGGNIGTPLISLVETSSDESWLVAELSSFQLETIVDFHPNIAVVLNVTPNHMDRYEKFRDYAAAKHRIFMNQTSADVAVLNADDEVVSSWSRGLKSYVTFFSTQKELDEGLFLKNGRELVARNGESEKVLTTIDQLLLKGLHNVENVLAAISVGLACGADPESMRDTIRTFRPVEHRLEYVGELEGVRFFNDSKATSVDAAKKALEAFSNDAGKIVLIMGGKGKRAPYAPLADLIKHQVRNLVLIGEDAGTIKEELGGIVETVPAGDMEDAIRQSFSLAQSGDSVLLAPACASFDMFTGFEQRGVVFKESVARLIAERQQLNQSEV